MATNTTPTTLGSLEFSQIKSSLTEYLRDQSVFSGYNFDGSAMQTIIDLLAYNTFYYAYYANIINAEAFLDSAQKEDSIISICKPLGFTVPASTSPKAQIKAAGITDLETLRYKIVASTKFFATNSDGIQYSFYTIDDIDIDGDGNTANFFVYEATNYNEFDALPTFDFDNQRIVIANSDFDLATLKVTITENDTEVFTWTAVGNVGYVSQTTERIYFVERTSNGFIIVFGSKNSLGRTLTADTTNSIIIRYLTTSGSDANNLSVFTQNSLSGNVVLTTTSQSAGGRSKPDLDSIRFLAPKWFASQERAITINDYKALLIDAAFFEDETQFNVFGGQDLVPPRYGRVFVTSNLTLSDTRISEFIDFLKERSVITVLPEYVVSNALSVFADFTFKTVSTFTNKSNALNQVKSKFSSTYEAISKYNVSFSTSDFIDDIQSDLNNGLIISPDDFTIYVEQSLVSGKEYIFNLENELYLPVNQSVDITEPFACAVSGFPTNSLGILRIYSVSLGSKNTKQPLQLWAKNNTTGALSQVSGDFGYAIANTGTILINNDVISTTATLHVEFKKKSFSMGLNNLVTFVANNVNIL